MLVTDGRVLDDARRVAAKLNIELRHAPIPGPNAFDEHSVASGPAGVCWTFDGIWEEHVMPLVGQVLTRPDGSTNEILSVDWSGLERRSSGGSVQMIDIEIFRWAIERLLNWEVVLRDEINAQYPKRASSGIVLVLGSLPLLETVKQRPKKRLRLRTGL